MERIQYDGKIPKEVYRYLRDNHKCIGCGKCCNCSPIIVTPKDIKVMAFALNLSPKDFKEKYTTVYPGHPGFSRFKQAAPCAFLDENNRCKIYNARPDVCRDYPLMKGVRIPKECQTLNDLVDKIIVEKGIVNKNTLEKAKDLITNENR